jgi:hypothetical protein
MSLDPLPANAQLHYEPADHSYVTVDGTVPFYAQATLPVNQFAIPPFKYVALTNDDNGDPTYIAFKDTGPNGTTVAALSCTYYNRSITSIYQVI